MVGEVRWSRGGRLRSLHVIRVLAVVQDCATCVPVNDIRAEMIVKRIRCHIAQIVSGIKIVFERLVFRNLSILQFVLWRWIFGVAKMNRVRSAKRSHGSRHRAGARAPLHDVRVRIRVRRARSQSLFASDRIILFAYVVNNVTLNSATSGEGNQKLIFNIQLGNSINEVEIPQCLRVVQFLLGEKEAATFGGEWNVVRGAHPGEEKEFRQLIAVSPYLCEYSSLASIITHVKK